MKAPIENKKNIWKRISLVVLALFIFILVLFLVMANNETQKENTNSVTPTVQLPKEQVKSNYETEVEEISKIAKEVASAHKYKVDEYDCTQFSLELKKKLIEKGYDAYCQSGVYRTESKRYDAAGNYLGPNGIMRNDSLHIWVAINLEGKPIPIEATNGEIISDTDYSIHYQEFKQMKEVCW
jgi:hypothetical protein